MLIQPAPPANVVSAPDIFGELCTAEHVRKALSLPPHPQLLEAVTIRMQQFSSERDLFCKRVNDNPSLTVGNYSIGTSEPCILEFVVDEPCDVVSLALQLYGLKHKELLTAAHISALQQVNSDSYPQFADSLQPLRAALEGGYTELPVFEVAPTRMRLPVTAEALQYASLQAGLLSDTCREIVDSELWGGTVISERDRIGLQELQMRFEQVRAFGEAKAIALKINIRNEELLLAARVGIAEPLVGPEDYYDSLDLEYSKLLCSDSIGALNVEDLMALNAERERLYLESLAYRLQTSLLCAKICEAGGESASASIKTPDAELALRHLHSALLVADYLEQKGDSGKKLLDGLKIQPEAIRGLAKEAFPRAALAMCLEGESAERVKLRIGELSNLFFLSPQNQAVVGESLEVCSYRLPIRLLQTDSDGDARSTADLREQAALSYNKGLETIGLSEKLAHDNGVSLVDSDRNLAHRLLDGILRCSIWDPSNASFSALLSQKVLLNQGEEQAAKEMRTRDLLLLSAAHIIDHPSRFSPSVLRAIAGVEGEHSSDEIRAQLLDRLFTTLQTIDNLEVMQGSSEGLWVAAQRAGCQRAIEHALVTMILRAPNQDFKLERFSQLSAFNQRIREGEEESIEALQAAKTSCEEARLTIAAKQGVRELSEKASLNMQHSFLSQAIDDLRLSVQASKVNEARVALAADHPQLTLTAHEIIESIARDAVSNAASQRLLDRFKRENSGTALISACKEYLAEVNRDNPLYTLGLMLGSGALGALLAARLRREPGLGFLIGSCAALGSTKILFSVMGIDAVQAAGGTALSDQQWSQSVLNAMYLGTDLFQFVFGVSLISLSLKAKQGQAPDAQPLGDDLTTGTLLQRYGFDFFKRSSALLNPSTVGFWLVALPVSFGSWQIHSSELDSIYKSEAFMELAREVTQILVVAFLHDEVQQSMKDGSHARNLIQRIRDLSRRNRAQEK